MNEEDGGSLINQAVMEEILSSFKAEMTAATKAMSPLRGMSPLTPTVIASTRFWEYGVVLANGRGEKIMYIGEDHDGHYGTLIASDLAGFGVGLEIGDIIRVDPTVWGPVDED